MRDLETFDPTLSGGWPQASAADGSPGWSAEECWRQVEVFAIETKAGSPEAALRILLDDLTGEMRDEFDYFRKLRVAAEAAGQPGEEAAVKLARADLKLAVDAMQLIARTLEKIDSLQRQMARDRDMEAERDADGPGYVENRRRLLAIVELRAQERVEAILAERDLQRTADPLGGGGAAATGGATGPPGNPYGVG